MKPVNHVSFRELLRSVEYYLPAGDRGVHPDQVYRVLKLVTKADRSARLVEAAPGPDSLGKCLVLQPIKVTIECRIAGLDLKPTHQLKPPLPGGFECGPSGIWRLIFPNHRFGLGAVVGLSQDDHYRGLASRGNINGCKGRCNRPIVMSGGKVWPRLFDEIGMSYMLSGAEEPAAVSLDLVRRRVHGHKCRTGPKGGPRILKVQGTRKLVVTDLERPGVLWLARKHDLKIRCDSKPAGRFAFVSNRQQVHAGRIVRRHEHDKLDQKAVAVGAESSRAIHTEPDLVAGALIAERMIRR